MPNKIALSVLALFALLLAHVSTAAAQSTADFKKKAKEMSELSKKHRTSLDLVTILQEGYGLSFINKPNDEKHYHLRFSVNMEHPTVKGRQMLAMGRDTDYVFEFSETRVDGGKGNESAGSYLKIVPRNPPRDVPKKI